MAATLRTLADLAGSTDGGLLNGMQRERVRLAELHVPARSRLNAIVSDQQDLNNARDSI